MCFEEIKIPLSDLFLKHSYLPNDNQMREVHRIISLLMKTLPTPSHQENFFIQSLRKTKTLADTESSKIIVQDWIDGIANFCCDEFIYSKTEFDILFTNLTNYPEKMIKIKNSKNLKPLFHTMNFFMSKNFPKTQIRNIKVFFIKRFNELKPKSTERISETTLLILDIFSKIDNLINLNMYGDVVFYDFLLNGMKIILRDKSRNDENCFGAFIKFCQIYDKTFIENLCGSAQSSNDKQDVFMRILPYSLKQKNEVDSINRFFCKLYTSERAFIVKNINKIAEMIFDQSCVYQIECFFNTLKISWETMQKIESLENDIYYNIQK